MIQTILIGNITRDASVKTLESGKNIINFDVAINIGYGDKKSVMYVQCSQFTDKTSIVPYLLKGTKIYCGGEPSIREYDKKDGTKGFSYQLRVDRIELLGGNKQSSEQQPATVTGQQEAWTPPANAISDNDSQLPF